MTKSRKTFTHDRTLADREETGKYKHLPTDTYGNEQKNKFPLPFFLHAGIMGHEANVGGVILQEQALPDSLLKQLMIQFSVSY